VRPPEHVNLAGQDTGREHLSHTSLSTLLACEQRWYWGYERRLRPVVTAEPLRLGRAFAAALAAGDPTVAHRVCEEDAAAARANASPWVVAPPTDEVETGARIVESAAAAYLDRFGSDVEREVELRQRIRNPDTGRYSRTHDLLCRVDGLALDRGVLVEDKLLGSVQRGTLAQRVRLDRQVLIGCYLVWRCTGTLIGEVRYRVVLKPQIRRRNGESHREYLDRIADEYKTRPDHYLIEEVTHPDTSDFARLERELWAWVSRLRAARREGTWPRNTSACHDYGGCRFLPLCAGEPGAIQQYTTHTKGD
jgi:hypothetical protein